ncbi:MAG: response regulator [Candidatus Paceibacterota bacterium]|jgi:DNA-binding response OmpR family regulator
MKTQKTILIIEDEKSLRGAVVDILRLKNFLTLEARNGKEGVGVALSRHPDLILLDIIMPEMDGMAALKKIREDNWGKMVPIIILTNLSGTIEQLMNEVVTQYLIKSDWKLHDIVKKIEEILKNQNTARAALGPRPQLRNKQ